MLENTWEAWLGTRPAAVQQLAQEFPLGSHWHVAGQVLYLLGYTEDDCLLVSPIDPAVDYQGALITKEYLHAAHVRQESTGHEKVERREIGSTERGETPCN